MSRGVVFNTHDGPQGINPAHVVRVYESQQPSGTPPLAILVFQDSSKLGVPGTVQAVTDMLWPPEKR